MRNINERRAGFKISILYLRQQRARVVCYRVSCREPKMAVFLTKYDLSKGIVHCWCLRVSVNCKTVIQKRGIVHIQVYGEELMLMHEKISANKISYKSSYRKILLRNLKSQISSTRKKISVTEPWTKAFKSNRRSACSKKLNRQVKKNTKLKKVLY